jgi:hypothetical protein
MIRQIILKADELAAEYNKTKDPLIREEWFQVVRSLDNYQPSHNEISDTILKPLLQVAQKVRHHTK